MKDLHLLKSYIYMIFTVNDKLFDCSIKFIFESTEFKMNPCKGFKEHGFNIFNKVKPINVFAGHSAVGQILVILRLVGLMIDKIEVWLNP